MGVDAIPDARYQNTTTITGTNSGREDSGTCESIFPSLAKGNIVRDGDVYRYIPTS